MHFVEAPYLDYEHDGYLPELPNVGGGDDVEIEICLECGQVQGEWPVGDSVLTTDEEYDDEPRYSSAEREQRQLDYLSTLPDKEETINLSKQFYDVQLIMSPDSLTIEDAFNDKLKTWLAEHGDCCVFDENSSEWGSLVFNNVVNASKFASHFDLSYISSTGLDMLREM